MRFSILLVGLLLVLNKGIAQTDSSGYVLYDSDFKFADGIFISFEQVKKNAPVIKSRIISNVSFKEPVFFENIMSSPEISYYDNLGMKQTVLTGNVWGYAKNGNLYIRVYDSFNKITYIGSICHFVASVTITYQPVYDPYYYNTNYYRSAINSTSNSKTEIRQFILDFDTGKVYEYEGKNLEILLFRDPPLLEEYLALSKKRKKQMMFYYIRKFNERNQLKFPVSLSD